MRTQGTVMKKLSIILLLVLSFRFTYSQDIDTLFFTDGSSLICTINSGDGKYIDYYRTENFSILSSGTVKMKNVVRYAYGKPVCLEFSRTIKVDSSLNRDILNASIKNWFLNPTKGVIKKITYEDAMKGEYRGKFEYTYSGEFSGMKDLSVIGPVTFDVSVKLGNGYCYCIFSNFDHSGNDHAPGGAVSFHRLTTQVLGYTLTDTGSDEWRNQTWMQIKKTSESYCQSLFSELESMTGNK
jgi:hypothetical protein